MTRWLAGPVWTLGHKKLLKCIFSAIIARLKYLFTLDMVTERSDDTITKNAPDLWCEVVTNVGNENRNNTK